MEPALVRFKGQWYKIVPKAFEPERITEEIAWMKLKNPAATYADWYKRERNLSKILYNEQRTS